MSSSSRTNTLGQQPHHGMGTPSSSANKYTVPVTPVKKRLSLTLQRQIMRGSTIPKNDEQMVLFSGECSYKFKFRLIGLERINVLFNEIQEHVATFNKNTQPRNVTLFNENAIKASEKEEKSNIERVS